MPLHHHYADALEGLYVPHTPMGFADPSVLLVNRELATSLGLVADELRSDGADVLAGSIVVPGTRPLAQAYAGHQFGGFTAQLGDGRAVLLGELADARGVLWDVQLKGSGPTVFSRGGDGLATVSSVLREYLFSEGMHHLGAPSTRSLAVVLTGESVRRNPVQPGAVLTRIAASHIRVGSFQFFAVRRDLDKMKRLVEYTLGRHGPEGTEPTALALLRLAAVNQAELIAAWMAVGFVHGVMNTDNTTISGETIDYGPCAFMDEYDPATVFSSIDHGARYAFGRQPHMAQWNLARLAEALLPLLHDDEDRAVELAEAALELFAQTYSAAWSRRMAAKVGLPDSGEVTVELVSQLLALMHDNKLDFTQSFRGLSAAVRGTAEALPSLVGEAATAWRARWIEAVRSIDGFDATTTAAAMDLVNPIYIPRNHLVEWALSAATAGDMEPFVRLQRALSAPFTERDGFEGYALAAPADFGPHQTFCGT